jgi:hypothetical protein
MFGSSAVGETWRTDPAKIASPIRCRGGGKPCDRNCACVLWGRPEGWATRATPITSSVVNIRAVPDLRPQSPIPTCRISAVGGGTERWQG